MKPLAKALLLCVLAAGCAKTPDPLQEALSAHILHGREGTFRLYSIEKIDSTTFRTEFEHRQNVFERKLQEETKLFENYYFQNKRKNADRHWEAMERTREVMKGLDSLRAALAGRMDEVAYYEYVFSGRAETGSEAVEFKDTYVSMSPSLEVITMSADRADLHKSGGRAIPGYLQMFGDSDAKGEDGR